MPGTAYDEYYASDEFMIANKICMYGVDGHVCRTAVIVRDALRELRRAVDEAIRACIEGKLNVEHVYEKVIDITKRVATQVNLDGEEFHRVDTVIEWSLKCGGEWRRSDGIGVYIIVYRGSPDKPRRDPDSAITEVCRQWLSEECRQPRTLEVHYWVAIRNAFDKQRVLGKTDNEYFRFAVLGIDGIADDVYVLTNKPVLHHIRSTVYASLETDREEDYLSSLLLSNRPRWLQAAIVPAECRDGILRMHIYNEKDDGVYPVICRAYI